LDADESDDDDDDTSDDEKKKDPTDPGFDPNGSLSAALGQYARIEDEFKKTVDEFYNHSLGQIPDKKEIGHLIYFLPKDPEKLKNTTTLVGKRSSKTIDKLQAFGTDAQKKPYFILPYNKTNLKLVDDANKKLKVEADRALKRIQKLVADGGSVLSGPPGS
jgi:hypothetical protein